MKAETSDWLEPLFIALRAYDASGETLSQIIGESKMSAAEADDENVEGFAQMFSDIPGARTYGLDWIRVGQLIIDKLGIDDYPEFPPPSHN